MMPSSIRCTASNLRSCALAAAEGTRNPRRPTPERRHDPKKRAQRSLVGNELRGGAMATPTANGSQQDSSPYVAPQINLPKGGGAIRGIGEKFAANPVTGSATFSIPLPVSPGRGGFNPQIT